MRSMMRVFWCVSLSLSLGIAYYIYIPLPETVGEPWKLMLLDATIRSMFSVGSVVHALGLCHPIKFIRGSVKTLQNLSPVPSGGPKVHDTTFAGVDVRVYESSSVKKGKLKRGLIFLHGGGWALGSNKERSYDLLCRKMSEELKAVVVSVEYRLVPDVYFPVQYEDCLVATTHFLRPEVLALYSVDPAHVGISGDSAGGNLAAAVAQQVAVDDSISVKLSAQALIYPVLQALDFNTPSYLQNEKVPILYRRGLIHFWLQYLKADQSLVHQLLVNNHTAKDQEAVSKHRAKFDWTTLLSLEFHKKYKPVIPAKGTPNILEKLPALLDVRASPLLAEDEVLRRTPRAFILTCEHDVLRDDGLMYARRLQKVGVAVTSDLHADGFHGILSFFQPPISFDSGERAVKNLISWLNDNL